MIATSDDLAGDWAEKYLELAALINDITGEEPPTPAQEQQFQELKQWFFDHERAFLPLWEDFLKDSGVYDPDEDEDEANLFQCFYAKPYLGYFRITYPDFFELRFEIISLGAIAVKFSDWACEQY